MPTSAAQSPPSALRPDQVTKITILVSNYSPKDLQVIEAGRMTLFGENKPTDTL